jgi:pimeloyl-ACP methyl ester carboxylesterase
MIVRVPDGRKVFYALSGDGADILILHGAASDADTMAPLARELSDSHRLITMDRLGYRRSSRLTRNTTLEEQAIAVEAVRRDCGAGQVWLCGHSSGGNVAAGYATLFPEAVLGLVLIEPPLYALYPNEAMPQALKQMTEGIVPLFEAGDIEEGIRQFTRHLEIPPETWSELARSGHGKNADQNWPPLRYEFKFALEWPRSPSDLRSLTHPLLVLEGERTTALLRGASQLLLDALAHATRITLPDCDHLAPIVRPAIVAQQIARFVQNAGD